MSEKCKMFKVGESDDVAVDMLMTAAMTIAKTIIEESLRMPNVIVDALVKSSEAGMNRMIDDIERDIEADDNEKAVMIEHLKASHAMFTRFAVFAADLKADMRKVQKPENAAAIKNLTMLLAKKMQEQKTA